MKKRNLHLAISLLGTLALSACNGDSDSKEKHFNRIASFPVCAQIDADCNTDTSTAAEIVAASEDGMTLVYTDSPSEKLGFVDISSPSSPQAAGTITLSGEPTSVTVKGQYALVAVNTSTDYEQVSGELSIIDITTKTVVASLDLGGQPDSIALSPDGNYAAVVLENERDEDLGEGLPPQLPAGEFLIVDTSSQNPSDWSLQRVDITGVATLFSDDPEPEYVDINEDNIAVISLQENNHIILVDLETASILNEFSAGSVNLTQVDLTEGDYPQISQTESIDAVVREPDGVTWLGNTYFATADEGDMDGGSRGFTVFDLMGDVTWSSGNRLDHLAARYGHYPDARSANKGNEPENVEFSRFEGNDYLFVNSERSSLIFVYKVNNPEQPELKQTLPTGVAPEGGLAIPSRNLLVVANEEDSRGDKIRASISIYEYSEAASSYPTIESVNRDDGSPIPWAALSGLSADIAEENTLYAVEDSFYTSNRIFKIDTSTKPATIVEEITIKDSDGVFAAISTSGAAEDALSFDDVDLASMINADNSVNIDPEGIAHASDGGFWIASEGAGTLTDTENHPLEKLNFLFKTSAQGIIENVVTLPDAVNAKQIRFGFEGVAEYEAKIYVAFQRAWEGDSAARIGIYDTASTNWEFVNYPLDAVESQAGGWVGLSEITSLGNGEFLIVERDNAGGPDAAIKRLYKIDLNSVSDGDTLSKTLVRDLMDDLKAPGGLVSEKIEGAAIMQNGDVYIVNDNDGVDASNGETQLLNLGNILN